MTCLAVYKKVALLPWYAGRGKQIKYNGDARTVVTIN
jgi:hypothetical protein